MKRIKTNIENINNMTREQIAEQYFPLVYKIANQLSKSSGWDLAECNSAGRVGLAYAIDHYDVSKQEGKKPQSFMQYAGYMIRFYILNDVNQNSHIIRVNQDQQKKLKEAGQSVELTFSLDRKLRNSGDEDECTFADMTKGDDEASIYAALDPSEEELWKGIFSKLEENFSGRDIDIFYNTFGVNGREAMDGKAMALKYGISAGAVTQIRNKIVKYMRNNAALREDLLNILQLRSGENYGM